MSLNVLLALIATDPDLMARFLLNREFFLNLSQAPEEGLIRFEDLDFDEFNDKTFLLDAGSW